MKYITSDPEILSGKPVIAGTRIPVARVVYLLKDGFTLEGIHKQYPHVPIKILGGVVDELIMKIDKDFYESKVS